MNIFEDWGDVMAGGCADEEAGSRVLNVLEFVKEFGG